jgi:hypothetical protein
VASRRLTPGAHGYTNIMILLLALLLVLLFFGLSFAVHLLWIVAVVFFVLWLVGAALGRGESAGRHRFYRW